MKYFKFLFSGSLMGILLLAFAVAVGYATIIESTFDPTSARLQVYNTGWFEVMIFLMVVNFTGMIFTRKLYTRSQLNILIIHIALIVIIAGAAITRYIGFEGQMHIRNGQTINQFLTTETYFDINLSDGKDSVSQSREILLSLKHKELAEENLKLGNRNVKVIFDEYYPNASEVLVRSENGSPYINIIVGGKDGRHDLFLKEGTSTQLHDLGFSFGDTSKTGFIQIIRKEGKLFVNLPDTLRAKSSTGEETLRLPGHFYPVELMSVHTINNASFLIKDFMESAVMKYAPSSNPNQEGSRIAKISLDNVTFFTPIGKVKNVTLDNNIVATIYVGNKIKHLPFSIRLDKFILERYPGSNSPSSYASNVQVIDEEKNKDFAYKIYMNNILNYRGYRFFQTSYDQDENGTFLTVNHDYWGTLVTYLGYLILFGSLVASFFTRKTRFKRILQQISEVHALRKNLKAGGLTIILLLVIPLTTKSQNANPASIAVSKDHAESFGELLVQDKEGRIVPVNTLAINLLVKIYKKDSYDGLSANQFFLDVIINPDRWQREPLIKVGDPSVLDVLGTSGDYVRFLDFLDDNGNYKLQEQVEQAYMKQPANRNTFDKEIINVDERANVLYMLLNGSYLTVFPLPNNENNKWVSPSEYHRMEGHDKNESMLFNDYLQKLIEAKTTGNYATANALLQEFKEFQKKAGAIIIPSDRKIHLEIFYNRMNIFKKLFPFYLTLGLLMVGIFLIQTFKPSLELKLLRKILIALLLVAFLFHTVGLVLRWYISGHAPWSNGYESMIYISWAIVLAGFIFSRISYGTLGITSILSGITLLTAHMSWMNPEITNLVPVLKSYWLTIHVATITASYGFLALGCMMGFLNLIIMIFRDESNQKLINPAIREITLIVELTLAVGLILLVIGNFLGAIWANESWGRYWGWDPKESWTLVSVIIYSLILHLRLIPSLRNTFTFNFFAVLGFGTILMTYFGVNYYLTGLHSYAGGDSIPIPSFLYYIIMIIAVVGIFAWRNENRYKEKVVNGFH